MIATTSPEKCREIDNGLTLASRAATAVVLGGAVLMAAIFQIDDAEARFWPAIVAPLVMATALAIQARWPGTPSTVLYLLVGGVAVYVYSRTFASQVPVWPVPNAITVALPKMALILIGGSGRSPGAALRWCAAGFATAVVASSLAILHAGYRFTFDVPGVLTFVLTTGALLLTWRGHRNDSMSVQRLNRAARVELESTLQHRVAVRNAALIHDTVLNQLAVLATSATGTLHDSLRSAIRIDLEKVVQQPAPVPGTQPNPPHASPLHAAVLDATTRGLEVSTTGRLSDVLLLDTARSTAVGLAVRQCLQNVEEHSGVLAVEVVVLPSNGELMVMISDGGTGFDADSIPADRLGLRNSVTARIGAVGGTAAIWSAPGIGTSVVLRVPLTHAVNSTGVST
ncbi:sensor histidine kinase [Cryobacterium soli]|uniref:sensor histidine kinase n=1 Tax=Cryobacterium soli TaxID=2220095 RepID=UPI000E7534E7|nr:hypothetical protein [Cryobacterium soli]